MFAVSPASSVLKWLAGDVKEPSSLIIVKISRACQVPGVVVWP